jgi:hypothetical protein
MVNLPFPIHPKQLKYIKKLQKICRLALRSMGIQNRINSHFNNIVMPRSKNTDSFEDFGMESRWKMINKIVQQTMTEHEQKIFKLLAFDQPEITFQKTPQQTFDHVVEQISKIIKLIKRIQIPF